MGANGGLWLVKCGSLLVLAAGCDNMTRQPVATEESTFALDAGRVGDGGPPEPRAEAIGQAAPASVEEVESATDWALVERLRAEAHQEMTAGAAAAPIVVVGHVIERTSRKSRTWENGVSYEDYTTIARVEIRSSLKGSLFPGEQVELEYKHNAHNVLLAPNRSVLLFLEADPAGHFLLAKSAAGGTRAWRLDDGMLRATGQSVRAFAEAAGYDVKEGVR